MLCLLLVFAPVWMCYAISEVTFTIVSQDNPIILECTATFNESVVNSVEFEWSESGRYILARNVYKRSGSSFQTTVYNQSLIHNTTLKLYGSNKLVSTLVIKPTSENDTFKCNAGNTNLTCRAFQGNSVYITPSPPSQEDYNDTDDVISTVRNDVYTPTPLPNKITFVVDPTTEPEEVTSTRHPHEEDTSLMTIAPLDDEQHSTVEPTDYNDLDITAVINGEMSSTTIAPLEEGDFSTAVGSTTSFNKEDGSTQFDEDIILLSTTVSEVYTPSSVSDTSSVVVHHFNESSREGGDDDDFVSSTHETITESIVAAVTAATHNITSVAVVNDGDRSTTKHTTTEKPLVVIYMTTKSVGFKPVDKEIVVGVANDNVKSSYSNKDVNDTNCDDDNNWTNLIKGIMIGSGVAVASIIVVLVLIQIMYQCNRMLTSRSYRVNVTPPPV